MSIILDVKIFAEGDVMEDFWQKVQAETEEAVKRAPQQGILHFTSQLEMYVPGHNIDCACQQCEDAFNQSELHHDAFCECDACVAVLGPIDHALCY